MFERIIDFENSDKILEYDTIPNKFHDFFLESSMLLLKFYIPSN